MEPPGAELALWTPVALSVGERGVAIDWGDLGGIRFTEPFFQQTVERWAGGDPRPLVRTGFDALGALDAAPSLDPSGLIFHLSRCGSTLLSRLLGTVPGTLVVSEPAPVNALLLAPQPDPAAAARLLRLMVRALGRRRFGDEHRLVLKLSSWNVRRLDLFRAAFPAAPAIWLQREPAAIAASLLARPPGWLGLWQDPAARTMFGLDRAPASSAEFCVAALASLFAAARAIDGRVLHLDYADLPAAAWERWPRRSSGSRSQPVTSRACATKRGMPRKGGGAAAVRRQPPGRLAADLGAARCGLRNRLRQRPL